MYAALFKLLVPTIIKTRVSLQKLRDLKRQTIYDTSDDSQAANTNSLVSSPRYAQRTNKNLLQDAKLCGKRASKKKI